MHPSTTSDATSPSPPVRHRQGLWEAIVRLDQDEGGLGDLAVLRDPQEPVDPMRPLLVLVHPGDAIEANWRGLGEVGPEVLRFSLACQTGMAEEIEEALADGWDAVVLHRGSCSQFETDAARRHVCPALRDAIQSVHDRGHVLHGDDLEAAADWISTRLSTALRPALRLSGAYSDPEHGCVTAVGRALMRTSPGVRVELSQHSYPGPDAGERWDPEKDTGSAPRFR